MLLRWLLEMLEGIGAKEICRTVEHIVVENNIHSENKKPTKLPSI